MNTPNGNDFNAWFQRNKKNVLIAGAVGLVIAAIGSAQETAPVQQQQPQGCGGPNQPPCQGGGQSGDQGGGGNPYVDGGGGGGNPYADGGGGGGGANPYAGGGGGGGGTDMDEWRRRQERDDEEQRRRIRTIREEERCSDGNVVSIHTGC